MRTLLEQRCRKQGLSMIELLVAILLLALAVVPMLNALKPIYNAGRIQDRTTVFVNQAQGTLNRLLASDFYALSAAQGSNVNLVLIFGTTSEVARESFIFDNSNWLPRVDIADRSGGTGGLVEVTVTLDQIQLYSQKAEIRQ